MINRIFGTYVTPRIPKPACGFFRAYSPHDASSGRAPTQLRLEEASRLYRMHANPQQLFLIDVTTGSKRWLKLTSILLAFEGLIDRALSSDAESGIYSEWRRIRDGELRARTDSQRRELCK